MTPVEALVERLPFGVRERLTRFVELLLEENQRLNLTSVREPQAAWALHVLDSLALVPFIETHEPRAVLDIGCGGGAPGLPLACVFESIEFTLIDATRKKVGAVNRIITKLELGNAHALWARAEACGRAGSRLRMLQSAADKSGAPSPELRGRTQARQAQASPQAQTASQARATTDPTSLPSPRRQRGTPLPDEFDALTARAVGPLSELLAFAAGLLRSGGSCWFHKSLPAAESEPLDAAAVAQRVGFRHVGQTEYELPSPHGRRVIVSYRRI